MIERTRTATLVYPPPRAPRVASTATVETTPKMAPWCMLMPRERLAGTPANLAQQCSLQPRPKASKASLTRLQRLPHYQYFHVFVRLVEPCMEVGSQIKQVSRPETAVQHTEQLCESYELWVKGRLHLASRLVTK